MDFDNGVISGSSKMQIQAIIADHTTLDFLQRGQPPLRFVFATLEVHDVQQDHPLSFSARVNATEPRATVLANGSIGPIRTSAYAATPLSGTYSVTQSDLDGIMSITGHARASGHFSGTFAQIAMAGNASIPDFCVGNAHTVRLDASYRLIVNGVTSDVEIQNAQVRTGRSLISASGSVAGSPKKAALTIATSNSRVEDLLPLVESADPAVTGQINFKAAVDFTNGPGKFLQRLGLKGQASVDQLRFVSDGTQSKLDAFSAREQADPSAKTKPGPPQDAQPAPPIVTASASSQTTLAHGIAYFPDIRVQVPGAQAQLAGTFNLLNTQIHITGKATLERSLSHATTGFKAALLKPLSPFFHHKNAGAIVSVAITGTASHPKLGQNVLHEK
jgi:hypothetical protein